MCEYLLTQRGPCFQNCDYTFDDPGYLQLDHITPEAGGLNYISIWVCYNNQVTAPGTGDCITNALSHTAPAGVTR